MRSFIEIIAIDASSGLRAPGLIDPTRIVVASEADLMKSGEYIEGCVSVFLAGALVPLYIEGGTKALIEAIKDWEEENGWYER